MPQVRLGIDVGGTFTDLVAVSADGIVTAKVPSTPGRADAILHVVRAADISVNEVAAFAHGTTVATNALLERTGARTALVTTAGFRDLIEIGRQDRPSLYDLTQARPPSLVPRDLRFVVRERMGPEGEIVPLHEGDVAAVASQIAQSDVEAVAVCFLFSYLHPAHERRAGELLSEHLPDVSVSLSSEVLPEFREFERFSTTLANAYLSPRLRGYLSRLGARVREAGLTEPNVMTSSGGVIDAASAAANAAACVLSGPAGGVVGAAYVAEACGFSDVLSFDMGGTSTDVAPIAGGRATITTGSVVAGVPIKLPMVDVHTVGAGGGSIGWIDDGGALRVGPRSAGADPGPASYGRGGTEATVTDADLMLGYIEDGTVLGGTLALDRSLAGRALAKLGEQLALDIDETAEGMVRVVEAEMAKALRVISVERGEDPRTLALIAFGGAGPMHACALAEELGMGAVLVPRAGGVLSALGLAISDERRDAVRPFHADATEIDETALEQAFAEAAEEAAAGLSNPRLERAADARSKGQSFELTVPADDPAAIAPRFAEAHETRYGYRLDDEPIEIVSVRVTAIVPSARPALSSEGRGDSPPRRRSARFEGRWSDVAVFDRGSLPADGIQGPAIVDLSEATCVVRPGWRCSVHPTGTLILERS